MLIHKSQFTSDHEDELTVRSVQTTPFGNIIKEFQVFIRTDDDMVQVPQYWAKEKLGININFQNHNIPQCYRLHFEGTLHPEQLEVASQTNGVLSLPTGFGKTIIALYIICKLKLKTLIIVHRKILAEQWKERIQQFIPTARIEIDIEIKMLQTVSMRDIVLNTYGLIIFDEVHVVPAPIFSKVLLKVRAPHMIGLSATPDRKDGLSKVIYWFLGPVIHEVKLQNKKNVTVYALPYTLLNSFSIPMIHNHVNLPKFTTMISEDETRNEFIISIIKKLIGLQHKILLLSDRREHCVKLQKTLAPDIQASLYLGGMKKDVLEISVKSNVILATFAMAKEGLDISTLSALILAHSKSDVTQACGRLLHSKCKTNLVVVDIIDQWFLGNYSFEKRKNFYMLANFNIKYKLN